MKGAFVVMNTADAGRLLGHDIAVSRNPNPLHGYSNFIRTLISLFHVDAAIVADFVCILTLVRPETNQREVYALC